MPNIKRVMIRPSTIAHGAALARPITTNGAALPQMFPPKSRYEACRKQAQIDNLDNRVQRVGYDSRTENLVQLSAHAIDRQMPLIYEINYKSLTPCQRILNLRGRSRTADCKALNQLRATKTQCVPRKQNAVDQLIKLPIVVEIVRK